MSDTHAFLWWQTGQKRRLGKAASRVFERASRGRDEVRVSVVSLFEIVLLMERGRLAAPSGVEGWMAAAAATPGLRIEPLTAEDVQQARGLGAIADPFDRLVTATAARLGVPLLTADAAILESRRVPVVWA